ncbi:hypothetical protein [Streptomyces anulatus]
MRSGEVTALVRGNGSGKSTAVEVLPGLLLPEMRDVRWSGFRRRRRCRVDRRGQQGPDGEPVEWDGAQGD